MAKRLTKRETVLSVVVLGAGVVLLAIAGLFSYISITTAPLHPDPQKIPATQRSTPPQKWADAVTQAEQASRAGLIEQNLPGLSVAVGIGSDLVWAEGFGYADLEKQSPVTPDLRFRIANVSNALTSAAVGLLLEKNKLKLDDEIQTYVPEYSRRQWPVTLRQLMAHVGGVVPEEGDEEPMDPCAQAVDGLQRFSKYPLRFQPGTQFLFSSYGWILVSVAVEDAIGDPFFTVMRTQVFEPFGMTSTRPDSVNGPTADRVTFYFPRFAGNTRYGPQLTSEGDHSCFAGGGAFLSTPSDLVRFGLAINSGTLLRPATVALLQTPQQLASGQSTDFGLGWKLETIPLAGEPTKMAGHETKPDFIGGTASFLTFPTVGMAVAVTSNTSFADTRSIAMKIAEAFAQANRAAR